MANYNVSVNEIFENFYSVKPVRGIKGMFAVRKKDDENGNILWYFFTSNNASYNDNAGMCMLRDIDQANSRYRDRLVAAYEKAEKDDKKIFWLALIFGVGIGLDPEIKDPVTEKRTECLKWMVSIEPRVSVNSITGSLNLRKFPGGEGTEYYVEPCYYREDQDKYFNTTFFYCYDDDGKFTDKYFKDYFEIYDNRPYHSVVLKEESLFDDNFYTEKQLGAILSDMCPHVKVIATDEYIKDSDKKNYNEDELEIHNGLAA